MSIARKVKRAGGLKSRHALKDKMVFIPGGEFTMGSHDHYAEEKPAHRTVRKLHKDAAQVKEDKDHGRAM